MKILLAGIGALALGLVAQDPFDAAEIEAQQVSGPVYMLTGFGGNIGLVLAEDGPLMIDDQFAELEEKIRLAVEELAGTRDPRFLVNTHWHGDHVGSNAGFGATSTLVAHANVRKRMEEGNDRTPPAPAVALPDLTYAEGLTVHLAGQEVELKHYPAAHTDGDTVVIFHQAKVVHMGDLMFNGMFPFIDLASGGTVAGYVAALDGVLTDMPEDWKIIPGHGEVGSHADLKTLRDMITETSAIVLQRKADGMDRDACVEAGLPEEWDSWSWQFISTERWLGTLYDGLPAGDR
ncbi:MAG: MBL fold metallo-hydrolase [Planctomycetota bacterium]|jgi:glyoxylase-like metal-dependent hydrolase (beta-lactamase superfamily II)